MATFTGIGGSFDQEYTQYCSFYTFALVGAFFSCLEFILDAFFVFNRGSITYEDFKKQDLKHRFKTVLPISDKRISRIYNELIFIRENIRNPLTHGLNDENNILVPLPVAGLVPISFNHLLNKINYKLIKIEIDEIKRILNISKIFFQFISKNNPYRYYKLYIDFGFPIPYNINEINKIKHSMASYKEFKKSLIDRALYESAVINREI